MIRISSSARATHADASALDNFSSMYEHEEVSASVALVGHLNQIRKYGFCKQFARNEAIFNQGDPAGEVFKVVSGTVRLCRYMPDGRRYIVDFLFPGDLMGLIEGADQSVSAEAVTEVVLHCYPRAGCDWLAEENSAMR